MITSSKSAVPGLTLKAWALFLAGGVGPATFISGFNVASVTHPTTGNYVVTFTSPLASSNGVVIFQNAVCAPQILQIAILSLTTVSATIGTLLAGTTNDISGPVHMAVYG